MLDAIDIKHSRKQQIPLERQINIRIGLKAISLADRQDPISNSTPPHK